MLVFMGIDREKRERDLCKPLGAGGVVRGEGDFRISKAPLGILYYNIYYYNNPPGEIKANSRYCNIKNPFHKSLFK